ncbi:hypothetical protein [Stenotrophomonas maltophilia]|uniref:hypothetical protein n=1 Tax=Stenotrophomonas maltophilia TaxID=40324 RepID=UPI0021C9C34C|nr:hypothetical protein [Stenotrophomonas maltophilia]
MYTRAVSTFDAGRVYFHIASITGRGQLIRCRNASVVTNEGASIPGKQVGWVGQQESNAAVKGTAGVERTLKPACVQRQGSPLCGTAAEAGTGHCAALDECDRPAGTATGGGQTQGRASGVV